ncbi:Putative auto-transporter adhesin, head GIN domain [Hymenobacter gelipurpurascens]|uniref:Putative auto-transporter adhesin, head GIN domain n=1 Tax=Hymenobacter gelipurpurascens TaxID=89968 RepID=A0A212UGC0_9BACT|nr:head GIN domain-containing protein [Hymenobacter gelipurpurascens]SNC77308.1 Putative auto-transporter adhesin, head GIN domain [Hymenobacter gelipurpurascens]
MKTLRLLLPALLLALLVLPAFRPRVVATRETRTVSAFTSIGLAGSPTVILRQGSPQKVEVEGDAEDLGHLETTVSNGRLRIGNKKESGTSWYRNKGNVTVYITMPTIKALSVGGSGKIRANDAVKTGDLDLSVSGSGGIELANLTADKLSTSLAGSGTIEAAGIAPSHDVSVSGSGTVKATKLRSEACHVSISGSGDCRLMATKSLDASIVGSGDVYVMGSPKISSSIIGSGRIHRE